MFLKTQFSLAGQKLIKIKRNQLDPSGVKVFEVSRKADPPLCFSKFNFGFSITYIKMERQLSGLIRFAPLFPSKDKGFQDFKKRGDSLRFLKTQF